MSASGSVVADVYFNGGVTFVAVNRVDSKAANDAITEADKNYDFVVKPTVKDNAVTATGNSNYASSKKDGVTMDYIADMARFLGGLHKSNSAETIVLDGKTYTWCGELGLQGSNWTEGGAKDTAKTLVKAIDIKWGTVQAGNSYSVTLIVDGTPLTYTVDIKK